MTLYFDLDGVLADFYGEFARLTGKYWTTARQDPGYALRAYPEFFLRLPWLPGSKPMFAYGSLLGANVLSATLESVANSRLHKIMWCQRQLGLLPDRVVIVSNKEQKLAYASGNILVDDNEITISNWNRLGGYGLLFQSNPSQIIEQLYCLSGGKYRREALELSRLAQAEQARLIQAMPE